MFEHLKALYQSACGTKLVDMARPKNYNYAGMQFPKSRRVNYQGGGVVTLLGFVKLKIVE